MADTRAAVTLGLPGLQDLIDRLVRHVPARLGLDTDCATHVIDLTGDST